MAVPCMCGVCERCRRRAYEQDWRDENRERERARYRASYLRHRESRLLKAAERRAKNPLQGAATALVSRSVNKGVLERGMCEQAGEDCRGSIQAHQKLHLYVRTHTRARN